MTALVAPLTRKTVASAALVLLVVAPLVVLHPLPAAGQAGRRPAETQEVVLTVGEGPFKGDRNAKVTVVEFSDYHCPFCGRFSRDTLPQIEAEYIKTGKVKYVFRDFPIASLHPRAFKAHEAGHCAGEQGKYWEMHDRLFAEQKVAAASELRLHTQALDLDGGRFEECLNTGRYAPRIRQHVEDGKRATVRGTPTFFIGLSVPGQPIIKTVTVIRGAQAYSMFKEAIEDALRAAGR